MLKQDVFIGNFDQPVVYQGILSDPTYHLVGDFGQPVVYRGILSDTPYELTGHLGAPVIEVLPHLQAKVVTPVAEAQIIKPDSGYNGLSSVMVEAIPSNYGLITWDGGILTVS